VAHARGYLSPFEESPRFTECFTPEPLKKSEKQGPFAIRRLTQKLGSF
jgi:hypothetical protein